MRSILILCQSPGCEGACFLVHPPEISTVKFVQTYPSRFVCSVSQSVLHGCVSTQGFQFTVNGGKPPAHALTHRLCFLPRGLFIAGNKPVVVGACYPF